MLVKSIEQLLEEITVGSFGVDSKQALYAIMGSLIEVLLILLLLLVYVVLALKSMWFG